MRIDRDKMDEFIKGGVFTKEFLDFLFKEPEATLVYFNGINKFASVRDWRRKKDYANAFYLETYRKVGREVTCFKDVITLMGSSFVRAMQKDTYKSTVKIDFDRDCTSINEVSTVEDGGAYKRDSGYWLNKMGMAVQPKKVETDFYEDSIKKLSGDNYEIIKMYLDGKSKSEIQRVTKRSYEFVGRVIRNVAFKLHGLNVKSNRRISNKVFV